MSYDNASNLVLSLTISNDILSFNPLFKFKVLLTISFVLSYIRSLKFKVLLPISIGSRLYNNVSNLVLTLTVSIGSLLYDNVSNLVLMLTTYGVLSYIRLLKFDW